MQRGEHNQENHHEKIGASCETHRGDAGVVGHHEPADPVGGGQVGRLPGQGHLDAGGAPGDEVGQLPLPDPLQALVHLGGHRGGGGRLSSTPAGPRVERRGLTYLCGIHLALDDVEDGDVAVVGLPVPAGGHHHVLGLQQPPHHVQDRGLPHAGHLRGQRATGTGPALRARSTDARTEERRQHMSPHQTRGGVASLGTVFRFRPLLWDQES